MLKIITAEERLKTPSKINMTILGPSGSGKTSLARTLDPATTLFIDLEAGTLALQDWPGDIVDIRKQATAIGVHPWSLAKAIACWIGGPNPADHSGDYSMAAHAKYVAALGDSSILDKYDTVFVDSITVASRLALAWSKTQPAAISEKTGKPDNRGAYGLLGQEMLTWLTHLQHCPKSIIVVGILDQVKDDLGRITWEPQIEGAKTGRELPGIFDQVMTLQVLKTQDGVAYRAIINHLTNPWNFPAKDRSGCLDLQEPPDLKYIINKIRAGNRTDKTMVTTIPQPKPAETPVETPAAK